jgi:O-glycosyl hydrolase
MKTAYRLERTSALALLAAALGCSSDTTWLDDLVWSPRDVASETLAELPADEGNRGGLASATANEPAPMLADAGTSVVAAADAGSSPAPSAAPPSEEPPSACSPGPNPGSAGSVNVDLSVAFQLIRGFGGINVPGWIADLTPEQVDTAFGNGPGQIGMSILRVRVPYDPEQFALELPSAARAVALGATVIASPWTPPAALKSSGDIVGGSLLPESYGAYADHLLSFRDFMESNGVPIYAMSVQNEPDINVTYESCSWTAAEIAAWLAQEGPRFGATQLIAAESYNFNPTMTDPILQDPAAEPEVDIIGGHLYGRRPADYPLARSLGKELWMTEHYTDSSNPANLWPNALNVGKEIHDAMSANFSAYLWWYIRRAYGPITEDGLVSKRGYLMAQYAKFVRPGDVRVAASAPDAPDVYVTAYKGEAGRVTVVAVNLSTEPRDVTLDLSNSCVESVSRFTTSATEDVSDGGVVVLSDGRAPVTLGAQSVTTFVSR